ECGSGRDVRQIRTNQSIRGGTANGVTRGASVCVEHANTLGKSRFHRCRLELVLNPLFKVTRAEHDDVQQHSGARSATVLRTDAYVCAQFERLQAQASRTTWNGVHFSGELGHPKRMNDVAALQA